MGQCSLVLGAVYAHSADEVLGSSMVAGAHLGSRGKAIADVDRYRSRVKNCLRVVSRLGRDCFWK